MDARINTAITPSTPDKNLVIFGTVTLTLAVAFTHGGLHGEHSIPIFIL